MRLLPHSLFSRSALLIAVLMIAAQLSTAVLFTYWVQLPRLLVMVDLAESHLHSVRSALELLPDAQRAEYLRQMGQDHNLHLQQQAPVIDSKDIPHQFVIDKFLSLFEEKLLPNEKVIYQAAPERVVWVQIYVQQQAFWVKFAAEPFSADLSDYTGGLLLFMALLALLGGLIIHRTLNRPLQRLADVVNRIGKGQRIETIEEEGPKEIVAFIHALNRMNADLKQMDADRTLMLAGISHDLRTPITRIQLAMEMIGGDFDSALKNRVLANLGEIEGGLKQCLDFARDAADEPPQIADLNDLARLCAANYRANGYTIGLDLCEEADALIRPFAIERLLKNLLENAIKYANKDITIATGNCGQKLYLSVLDRGAGIAGSDIENLRRPFARADTSRGSSVGYGLGLAIVDKIVEVHQAKIEFLQRDGGGLEVRVTLS